MEALVIFVGFLGLLVLIAAPLEWAARRSPDFAARLDRLVTRVLG